MCTTADEENDDHALLCDSGDCCVFLPLQLLFLMAEVTPRLCSASSPYISCSSQFDPWFQNAFAVYCASTRQTPPHTSDWRPAPPAAQQHNTSVLLKQGQLLQFFFYFFVGVFFSG